MKSRLANILTLASVACFVATPIVSAPVFAQKATGVAQQAPGYAQQPPSYSPQPPGVSDSLASLADQPATRTSFTFDRSMLQIAQALLEQNGMDAKRAAAALTRISVETYHYPRPAFYTPEVMNSIIQNYNAAGWKHLVNANASPANSAQPHSMVTDLWLHFRGAEIDDLTVLLRGSKDMNVIEVSGLLRPLDLIHLSGHFGIPKVDPGAVMVTAPPGK